MTRIIIDTNIIISAALFPGGRAASAFYKAMLPPYEPLVCDYIVEELHRKFAEKFPDKRPALEEFLSEALTFIRVVETPVITSTQEAKIRDPKDRPILRAALNAGAELLITGDRDFLEAEIKDPRIISVDEFLNPGATGDGSD